jgi:hypothetical protein
MNDQKSELFKNIKDEEFFEYWGLSFMKTGPTTAVDIDKGYKHQFHPGATVLLLSGSGGDLEGV